MSDISAAMVKELREITGAGMMDCKKALVECNGDFEASKEFLRKRGQAIANKKSSRETKEGSIHISQVGLLCNKCNTAVRIRNKKLEDGKKVRICVQCGDVINVG